MANRQPLPCKVVVLISGSGSNLQAIIDQQQAGQLPIEIVAVISNKADAKGLARAAQHGITTRVLNHKDFETRERFDAALMAEIDAFMPDLVVLAGFMRILTPGFTQHYEGRMLNIHPSLLPKYQGLHTHQRAIDAGDSEHGVSVHFVTAELDGGPVVGQARVPVLPDDTTETLAARVLEQEHKLYPEIIGWFAEGRLKMHKGLAMLDGKPVSPDNPSPG